MPASRWGRPPQRRPCGCRRPLAATSSPGSGNQSWTDGNVVKFGDPNLALGTGTTAGTFSSVFDIDNFAGDGDANISGLHKVGRTVVVGSGGGSFTLLTGDVLLAVDASETLGGVVVSKNDIVLFRPTTPGNYSAGTFSILLQNPTTKQLADFTLVEQTTVVGGTTLQAGTFIIAEPGKKDVYRFDPTSTGAGTTTGTLTIKFIEGSLAGIDKGVSGLELIQTPITLGGVSLTVGQLLVSLDADDSAVGSNNLAVTKFDTFVLSLTGTGAGTTAGTAAMLLKGADVGLTSGGEEFDALALVGFNQAPVLSGANNLSAIAEDPVTNPGTLVSALISGRVTDGDAGALTGIAVTGVDNANGSWQWSANGGVTWNAFGSPSAAASRLLTADANTYVRFVPNANWSGTVTGGITFRAWDQTTGTAGLTANTSTNGNATAFSAATASSSITVTAVNDPPVITVGGGDSASKTLAETDTTLATSGTLTVNDVDLSDTVTPSVTGVVLGGTTGGLVSGDVLGMLTVGPGSIAANPGDSNNLNWAFNSGAQAFDFLDDGESLTLTYTVRATDNNSATDNRAVVITINGTNDAPLITVGGGDAASAAMAETNTTLTGSGTLTVTDADLSDSVSPSVFSVALGGTTGGLVSGDVLGMLSVGPGSIAANTGNVNNLTWTFNSGAQAFDFLDDGESLTLTYTVRATDDSAAFDDQTVVITINGTNDAPLITVGGGDSASKTLAETNATLATSGTLTVNDADLSDSVTPER